MTWLVKTSPHWLVRWSCGCVKAECHCRWGHVSRSGKLESTVAGVCPEHGG